MAPGPNGAIAAIAAGAPFTMRSSPSLLIGNQRLGGLGRGIERREPQYRAPEDRGSLRERRCANGAVHRIVPCVGAGQRGPGEDVILPKVVPHRLDGRDHELVAREGPGLVRTQDIDGGGLVDGRQAGQQNPSLVRAWALKAAASVKVAGSATGTEASSAVNTSGMM